jgi:hypothetical protein
MEAERREKPMKNNPTKTDILSKYEHNQNKD